MKHCVEEQPNLTLRQELVEGLLLEDCDDRRVGRAGASSASLARGDTLYRAAAVILTTGTFLKAIMHTGEAKTRGGRAGDDVRRGAERQPRRRAASSWPASRPARPAGSTAAPSTSRKCEPQPGDDRRRGRSASPPTAIDHAADRSATSPTPTTAVHDLIRANLHRAPMYSGQIHGRGPRYCPSIEDKVVRFADKDRHQIFLEPEGLQHPRVLLQRHQHQPAQGRAAGDAAAHSRAWRTRR